ncbi:MAG: rhomboid family intramembrane serine protease [Lysobacterales bacterium]|jgi:membrane associated rhomboid family serine protease|nr:MAG: rhomboid family intramembrane serine protease [Xanthomonadales bacterium]
MLPVADGVATRREPLALFGLLLVNAVVFLLQSALSPEGRELLWQLVGLVPIRFFEPELPGIPPWATLLTSQFLHGDLLHLLFNLWTLWLFGRAVEDRLGSLRFLGFYLLCGVAAGFMQALLHPFSAVPTIGASGAISGVLGCYARLFPFSRLVLFAPVLFLPLFFEVPALLFALFWLVTQIVPGLFALGTGLSGGIAWWAHIGGFAAGWLIAPWLKERRRRCFYPDECRYGLSPHGRRRDPRAFWD